MDLIIPKEVEMTAIKTDELRKILSFIKSSEKLKSTLRSAHTSTGRTESVAEHTWRLCLMVLVLDNYFPEVNMGRVLKLCIIHDLGEAVNGDIPAPMQSAGTDKSGNEREDFLLLLNDLPGELQHELTKLWDEYDDAATPEAQIAKALDKLETITQHNQGDNPDGFDYSFNLDYGKEYTQGHPVITSIREILDKETKRNADKTGS